MGSFYPPPFIVSFGHCHRHKPSQNVENKRLKAKSSATSNKSGIAN